MEMRWSRSFFGGTFCAAFLRSWRGSGGLLKSASLSCSGVAWGCWVTLGGLGTGLWSGGRPRRRLTGLEEMSSSWLRRLEGEWSNLSASCISMSSSSTSTSGGACPLEAPLLDGIPEAGRSADFPFLARWAAVLSSLLASSACAFGVVNVISSTSTEISYSTISNRYLGQSCVARTS